MRSLELWVVRRFIRNEVRQGFDHKRRITNLYQLVRKACEQEFTEDNVPTLSSFLSECFEQTQAWPLGKSARASGIFDDTNPESIR